MSVIVDGKVKLTYREYRHFPDDGKTHELIDGEHYVAPAPGTNHQSISRHIQFQLYQQLELTERAEVYDAPTDVELSEIDVVQPDILVVSHARRGIISPSRIIGSPELVVEIISPSSGPRDRELKRGLYERRGVAVYWLVDPEAQTVTVFELKDGAYRETGSHREEVRLELPGLEATVDLTRVW
ncbi:MAG: Uma2 family endonuclease [Spirochaetales bacterium]|nr:Uma2 family endonuclease [Spirochaetales bacterium]